MSPSSPPSLLRACHPLAAGASWKVSALTTVWRPQPALCPPPQALARNTVGLQSVGEVGGGVGGPMVPLSPAQSPFSNGSRAFSTQSAGGPRVSEPPGQAAQGWAGLPACQWVSGSLLSTAGPPLGRAIASCPCPRPPNTRGPHDSGSGGSRAGDQGLCFLGRKFMRRGSAGWGVGLWAGTPM